LSWGLIHEPKALLIVGLGMQNFPLILPYSEVFGLEFQTKNNITKISTKGRKLRVKSSSH
jgi:hypothetical protein